MSVRLADRAAVVLGGEAARAFLQGLVSNDVGDVAPDRAIYAALLTPQGKYLFDFFIIEDTDGAFLLDVAADRRDALIKRLKMYRLRSKVTIDPAPDDRIIFALIGSGAVAAAGLAPKAGSARPAWGGMVYVDPRHAAIGARALLPEAGAQAALEAAGIAPGSSDDYEAARITLGLPRTGVELLVEESFPLELGFEELNGVDFTKGCYVGQEVTARMKHRGLTRRRLVPVTIEGDDGPAPGAKLMNGSVEAGVLRSTLGNRGLALVRIDQLVNDQPLTTAEGTRIIPRKPDWARL